MVSKSSQRPQLAHEIAAVLPMKFLALAIIWSVWFAEPKGEYLDGAHIGATIYSSDAAAQKGRQLHAGP